MLLERKCNGFRTQEAVPGKQGDDTKKGNKGLKLLKTIFMELLWNRTRRRNKKEQIQMSLFFHPNAICIVL
mgnify:CR=1 FL=1